MARAAKAEQPKTAIEEANERQFQNPGSAPDAHGEIVRPKKSGATVTVACKLGVSYYDLQLSRLVDTDEQTQTGLRTVKVPQRYGSVVRLRGTSYPRGTAPEGFPPPPIIVGNAAMNPGIDKDFWDEWVKVHHLDPLVVNGFIFAHESRDHVDGQAKERGDELSGLEPINPKKDKRMPKSSRSEISDVEGGKRPA